MIKLEELPAYTIAVEVSDEVWRIVSPWEWFPKRTIGSQYTEATDSVAANIAEGFGRFHKKDKIKFFLNARASTYESAHRTKRAKARGLLTQEQFDSIMDKLRKLPKEINSLIKLTNGAPRLKPWCQKIPSFAKASEGYPPPYMGATSAEADSRIHPRVNPWFSAKADKNLKR